MVRSLKKIVLVIFLATLFERHGLGLDGVELISRARLIEKRQLAAQQDFLDTCYETNGLTRFTSSRYEPSSTLLGLAAQRFVAQACRLLLRSGGSDEVSEEAASVIQFSKITELTKTLERASADSIKLPPDLAESVYGPSVAKESGSQSDAPAIIEAWGMGFQVAASATADLEMISRCLVTKRLGEARADSPTDMIVEPRGLSITEAVHKTAHQSYRRLDRTRRQLVNIAQALTDDDFRSEILQFLMQQSSRHEVFVDVDSRCQGENFYEYTTRYTITSESKPLRGRDTANFLRACPGPAPAYEFLNTTSIAPSPPRSQKQAASSRDHYIKKTHSNLIERFRVEVIDFVAKRYGLKDIPDRVGRADWLAGLESISKQSAELYISDFIKPIACEPEAAQLNCLDDLVVSPGVAIQLLVQQLRRDVSVVSSSQLYLADQEARMKYYEEDQKTAYRACGRDIPSVNSKKLALLRENRLKAMKRQSVRPALYLDRYHKDRRWHHLKVHLRDFDSMFIYTTRIKSAASRSAKNQP